MNRKWKNILSCFFNYFYTTRKSHTLKPSSHFQLLYWAKMSVDILFLSGLNKPSQHQFPKRSHKRCEFMLFLAFCCAHIKALSSSPHLLHFRRALFYPESHRLCHESLFNSHPFQFKFYLLRYHFTRNVKGSCQDMGALLAIDFC